MDTDEVQRRAYDRYGEGDPRGGQFAPANKSGMIGSFDTSRPAGSRKSQAAAAKAAEAPTAPRPSSKFKTLAPDEDNDPQAVAEMQQLLTALGLGNLSSGTYDEDTENAVKAVQARLGIKKPNGRANKALINKMLNAYDLSPCIKRSENPDGDEVERGRPYPGQRYRHGWIPMSPVALLPADAVDDEYGEELDSADFGEASRIVAREHGVTVESEQGDDIAIHAAPSLEDAERWADVIDSGETYSRQRFGHERYDEGGATIRFGDLEEAVDDPDEVAQALRDMAYTVEDHQNPPDDDIDDEPAGDETPIPDRSEV